MYANKTRSFGRRH